jgi:hypothetical protein
MHVPSIAVRSAGAALAEGKGGRRIDPVAC